MSRLSARYAQLIRMCRRRGWSREDAEDLVQEAHVRFFDYQRSRSVRDADSLLRRIVINLSITQFNRARALPHDFVNVMSPRAARAIIDPSPDPERTACGQQHLDRVVRLLSAVSPRTCQIFIAQRGGYSYQEIAGAFAVKPRTVDKHVAAAMQALTEMMPQDFDNA